MVNELSHYVRQVRIFDGLRRTWLGYLNILDQGLTNLDVGLIIKLSTKVTIRSITSI